MDRTTHGLAVIQDDVSSLQSLTPANVAQTLERQNVQNEKQLNDILDQYREKLKSLVYLYDRAVELNNELKIGPAVQCADSELRSMLIVRQLEDRQKIIQIIRGLEHDIDGVIQDADKITRLIFLFFK